MDPTESIESTVTEEAQSNDSPTETATTCQGSPDKSDHTWAAEPTGDNPYLHRCIKCGDTLTEDQRTA